MKELFTVYTTELIKLKKSFALWLVVFGALFIPLFFVLNIFHSWQDYLQAFTEDNSNPWNEYSRKLFNGVHFIFLPLLIVLLIALILNIEHKSNTWKHVFVLPVSKTKIFISKYLVMLSLIILFYLLLLIFYLLGGYIIGTWKPEFGFLNHHPSYLNDHAQINILSYILKSFIAALAIIAIHFWLSFRIKNLFLNIGIGLAGVVGTISMYIAHWHSLIYVPYGFPVLMCNYIPDAHYFLSNFQVNSLIVFVLVSIASYFDFVKFFKG